MLSNEHFSRFMTGLKSELSPDFDMDRSTVTTEKSPDGIAIGITLHHIPTGLSLRKTVKISAIQISSMKPQLMSEHMANFGHRWGQEFNREAKGLQ